MNKFAIDLTYSRLRYYESRIYKPIPVNFHDKGYLYLTYSDSLLTIF